MGHLPPRLPCAATIRSPGFEPCLVSAGMCVWTGSGANHNGLLVFRPGPNSSIFVTKMPETAAVLPDKAGGRRNPTENGPRQLAAMAWKREFSPIGANWKARECCFWTVLTLLL